MFAVAGPWCFHLSSPPSEVLLRARLTQYGRKRGMRWLVGLSQL